MGIFSEEIRCETLLVMILEKVEHVWLKVCQELPVACDAGCGLPQFYRHSVVVNILLHYSAQSVVKA